MKFPLTPSTQSISQTEEQILEYWKKEDIFKKTIETRNPSREFRFFDGPPFATGTPHYGHILAGTLKDTIPRYKTMQGYRVLRKWGWDCHGVPVEFQVEKEHHIGGKPGIEAMGIGNFNELCRSVVLRCRDQWEATVDRMGRFVDFQDDYKTMDADFMESVWWIFFELYNKGLIYEGEKVVAYSPKLGSPLSNFEAGLEYRDIDDPAITVKFQVTKSPIQGVVDTDIETFILAWTTTPWTLPSNLALAVHPELQYVLTKEVDGRRYILAEDLVEKVFKDGIDIEKRIDGASLVGTEYTPLFEAFKNHKQAFRVILGDFVSATDGTGIVHIAPNFGEDDARVAQENNIKPIEIPIDENGYFTDAIQELKGKYFRYDAMVGDETKDNANDWVIEDLKKRNLLFHRAQIRHSYPHCWRTECALMYRGIKTWFVDIQKIKQQMLDKNENINWIPGYLKYGRFGKGLESAPDWAISRNRYWGTPIPVWKCDKTGQIEVISSRTELEQKTGKIIPDIHRHFIDDLTWTNSETGGTMRRIPEVLDCWFESGSMPYASTHYPFVKGPRMIFKNQWYITRHAESENNVLKIGTCMGEKEKQYGLTEKGHRQAQAESERHKEIDLIFCSPLRRTRETAEHFARVSGAEIIIDERLCEVGLGDFDGAPYSTFEAFIKKHNIIDTPYPNGESVIDVEKRVVDFLYDIEARYRHKKILIVSHGLPIQILIGWGQGEMPSSWKGGISNAEVFDLNRLVHEKFLPADFIAEGLDQTRCWFYNLHVLGVAIFGKNIYKNVITNGIVLAEDGSKMAKSKKNYPDPGHVFDSYGADAMRFYLLNSPVARGENLRFSEVGVAEVLKSVILPLKSAYQFFATYANIDGWTPTRVILVRHGESEHNVLKVYSGHPENPHHLTQIGKQESLEVSKKIGNFDVLYSSPFIRTKETAEILKKESNFSGDILIDNRLRETEFGNLEGTPLLDPFVRSQNPTTEHPENTQKRMIDFLEEVNMNHPGKTVVMVTHSGQIRNLVAVLNDLHDLQEIFHIPKPNNGSFYIVFPLPNATTELDQWILSELQTCILKFREAFDAYNLDAGLKLIPEFIDKLNNWHLRRSRRRFWASGMTDEKRSGYETLHYVLYQMSKVLAPICPFLAEKMYQDLGGGESVHLELFPFALADWIDKDIEAKVNLSREIVSLAAGIRARKKIKLRQPLSKLQFLTTENADLDLDIIKEEANVKEVEILTSVDGIAQKIVRINAKKVGPRLGKKVQDIIRLGKEGNFFYNQDDTITIDGEVFTSDEYEIGFVCQEGVEADATPKAVVIVNTDISHVLEVEGYAREIIRAIQDLRKTSGFNVSDHITLRYVTSSKILREALDAFGTEIAAETLTDTIIDGGEMTLQLASDCMEIADEKAILHVSKTT